MNDNWGMRETAPELRQRYFAEGLWNDDTFASFLAHHATATPDLRVRTWSDERHGESTAGALHAEAREVAAGLRAKGLGAGDVIAYQMPNWLDTFVVLWAGFHLGAVMVPIIHFYGPTEVGFILRQSGAKAFVTVDAFGQLDLLSQSAEVADGVVEHLFVSGDPARVRAAKGTTHLDELRGHGSIDELPHLDPDAPAMVGYTSGTTADPKGVIHSHRSLLGEVRQLSAKNVASQRNSIMPSPMAHMTGMLGGSLMPLYLGKDIELIDRWDPARVLQLMVDADLGLGGGATVFLTSLLDHPDFGAEHIARMPVVGLGGAPVPDAVGERTEAMGIRITRAYGSTEHPSISGSSRDDPFEQRTRTDGPPLAGVEVRIVDEDGNDLPVGEAGEIWSRGPDLFAGSTDPNRLLDAVDADGWYHTGDVGRFDEGGALTITDRLQDLIIRGGLNLSAAEIEQHVATMDEVAEVAVVAAPDERLGEKACAVIRLRPGADAPDLAAVQRHVDASGLAKKKWPEAVRIVDDFDRTPSGKIKKRSLRDS